VTVTIRVESREYRVGELIPVDLTFTSSEPDRYLLDKAEYDCSGRVPEDKFIVIPSDGWEDPLADYFSGNRAFLGGGLRGIETLSSSHVIVRRYLNEYVRFTRPGTYTIRLKTTRVSDAKDASRRQLTVESPLIELKIITPEKGWTNQSLLAAIANYRSTEEKARRLSCQ
jgi:hypothetical protein